jgi:hypothetical protein
MRSTSARISQTLSEINLRTELHKPALQNICRALPAPAMLLPICASVRVAVIASIPTARRTSVTILRTTTSRQGVREKPLNVQARPFSSLLDLGRQVPRK